MLLSRSIAKRRIAAGVRPSFVGAWGLVLADLLSVVLAVLIAWGPFAAWFRANEPAVGLTIALIVVLFFIPSQVFLILSALWAAKSRWIEKNTDA
ncbi:hypothetical protein SAMN04488515_3356 [Cognatiyoonia koreensis]|uniref:RDD family protein n=1 Tax=Cognatiyoonia koreensis TaxID=364200 RepID=A0A1I0RVP1_9RHOB|nr:hypothetical protein [Cognatiyoonia koreensis]SEW45592.1 hypothetical protein SAMN04488515_3356 [Cognatiyoonia koreensis]